MEIDMVVEALQQGSVVPDLQLFVYPILPFNNNLSPSFCGKFQVVPFP
jgi:hypothetical protein